MADRKLNSLTFPTLPDRYILDAGRVKYNDADAFAGGTVGKALQEKTEGIENLITASAVQTLENKVPYLFRQTPNAGHNELDTIVGGTVAWNQLAKPLSNSNYGLLAGTANYSQNTVTLSSGGTGAFGVYMNNNFAISGHKYLILCILNTNASGTFQIGLGTNAGQAVSTVNTDILFGVIHDAPSSATLVLYKTGSVAQSDEFTVKNPMAFDLTQMFGSTVADYIYSLEQSSAGAGVAFFKKLFPNDYYPYDAGTLKSVEGVSAHEMVWFNQWDEVWERGAYGVDDGTPYDANQIRSKNYIPVLSDTNYYIKSSPYVWMMFFDENKNILTADLPNTGASAGNARGVGDATFKTPKGCAYIRFYCQVAYGTTYNNDICINLSGDRNGEYEPYEKHSYALDDSLTLRGIPKLDSQNNLYYDGDEYKPDGTVTRKYGVVDLSTLNWSYGSQTEHYVSQSLSNIAKGAVRDNVDVANAMCTTAVLTYVDNVYLGNNGVGIQSGGAIYFKNNSTSSSVTPTGYLVYELATPTTETAQPYPYAQVCDPNGTEEYVTTGIVPVGHDTKYPMTLSDIMPTASGNYVLKCTVTGGVATYEWVSES